METDRITVTGAGPAIVLIRISYHPRWKATTGERVWLAARASCSSSRRGGIELYFTGAGR